MKDKITNKKIYSILIGRYQPFHKGHKTLVDTLLKEGKNVLIALRDTEISKSNPYTHQERQNMIQRYYAKELSTQTVKIMKIPDIEEVCHGRKVGWGIRELKLSDEVENISATKIRNGEITPDI